MTEMKKAQILIVDDTPQNLKLLSEILSGKGYKVRPVKSGQLALRSIVHEAPDLILMDVQMPEMDGYEVCRCLKEDPELRNIPVIFISALDAVDDKIKGFEAGGVDYITKPFQPLEVLARVETHFMLWELQEQLRVQNMQLQNEIEERKNAEEALKNAYSIIELQVQERTEELRSANLRLAENESKVLGILNAIPDLLFVLNKEGMFIDYVAKDIGDLYQEPDRFINRNVMEVLPPSLAIETVENIKKALETGNPQIYEYQLPVNNEIRHYESHMAQCSHEQVVCIIRDITARKQIEETIRKSNEELDRKVKERTRELIEANEHLVSTNNELEKAYSELTFAQQKILHQEKMASIGQLASGVAHEINNPLGFIISNVSVLKNYVEKYQKLHGLLMMSMNLSDDQGCDLERKALKEYLDTSKFEFLDQDLSELFEETTEGLERVSKIVKSLRRFARVDSTSDYEVYDLNKELENTLNISRNEIKFIANVQCDLGTLPELRGRVGEINQVLLNFLLNAGAAIKAKHLSDMGTIEIRTWQDGDMVKISIRDDGEGIETDKISKIFDPFFTTKSVGEGTGLGLSISYDIIVNKHSGTVTVQSEKGKGTEFIIGLPITESE